jgi:two-component system KDP operon response regulator KdpE
MDGRKILIIDDDRDLVRLMERAFSQAGAQVYVAGDGQEGLRQLYAHQPDLVILDVLMPVLDGWQTLSRIRDFCDVPVIMFSVLGKENDIVRALGSGAIEYVTKPFSLKLLLARAQALLRQAQPPSGAERVAYDDGYLRIDLRGRSVSVEGEPVRLTGTEYRLLAYLVQHADHLVPYAKVLERVWGPEYADAVHYVHAYLFRLRRKLEADASRPKYLLTTRALGCCFRRQAAQY